MSDFGINDVVTLEDIKSAPSTRAFTARGREWPITIRTDGLSDPDTYYRLGMLLREWQQGGKTLRVPPRPTIGTQRGYQGFEVREPMYLANLALLSAVCLAPAFGMDEWAVFAKKLGAHTFAEIIAWALTQNGFDGPSAAQEEAAAGEATAEAICATDSLEPA